MVWLKFAACLAIILFSGTKLAHYGDAIAEKSGLGRIWVGLILLSAVTSMPELVTGVSAAALVKLPDLAVGNLLGSCLFNLMILAIMDIISRGTPVLSRASSRQTMSAVFGIVLAATVAGSIAASDRFAGPILGWVNISGILPLIIYCIAIWWSTRAERNHNTQPQAPEDCRHEAVSTKTVYLRFALAAAAVIAAGIWLSLVGDELAVTYGWHASFVGSLFLAITTSLPELVVSIAALRLGTVDMAVADILGSNMFNLALITPVDIAYRQGPVISSVLKANLVTALLAIGMSLIAISGIRMKKERKTFAVISWQSVAMIGLYIFGMRYIFVSGIGLG